MTISSLLAEVVGDGANFTFCQQGLAVAAAAIAAIASAPVAAHHWL